ncbi:MAG: hypothetical protein AB7T22_11385 [Calditrichaceae bacterium]
MKNLLIVMAIAGVIIFFPVLIGNSTSLFGYLTGSCFHTADHTHGMGPVMLNNYLKNFVLFWWGSIALAIYLLSRKNKTDEKKEIQ